jgi:hypothetical protein
MVLGSGASRSAPCQTAPGFHQAYLHPKPMGLGRPQPAMARLRMKTAKRNIVPLSVDEVARFWSSFRTSRDLAIVGLMLLQGLRALPAARPGNDSTARSLSTVRTARHQLKCTVCIPEGTCTRRPDDVCRIALLVPISSPDDRSDAGQSAPLPAHLRLRHDTGWR